MSLSDRVMRAPRVSPCHVRVGDPTSAAPVVFDHRPLSVREAETRHARELAALHIQHQEALETAYRKGHNDGAARARAEADKELKRRSELTASLVEEFARTRRDWFAAYEQQMVELIGCALEQILGDRPPVREHVVHALRRAIEQLDDGDRATVRCHPDDLPFVRDACEQPSDVVRAARRIRVTADEALQRGGCLVETDLGVVDARVEQQLRVLRGVLRDVAAESDPSGTAPDEPASDVPVETD
jgi:flagellar assembly protein FliH